MKLSIIRKQESEKSEVEEEPMDEEDPVTIHAAPTELLSERSAPPSVFSAKPSSVQSFQDPEVL